MQTSTANDGNRLQEWQTAREVLTKIDDRIHELRKYGFTVITALLAANSFLLPTSVGGKDALDDKTKFAAILAMLVLIVALRYVERNYQVFLRATSIRARILERSLNLELTEKISEWYRLRKLWHADLIYFFFATAALTLGLAVITFSSLYWFLLWALILFVAGVLYLMARYLKVTAKGDLTIDRLQCKSGEIVMVTVTNLGEDEPFMPNSVAFHVETQDGRQIQTFRWPDKTHDQISAWKRRDEFSAAARQFYIFLGDLVILNKHASTRLSRFASRDFIWELVSFLREKRARRAARKVRSVYPDYPRWVPFVPNLIWLGEMDSFVWPWDTTGTSPGIYRVVPYKRTVVPHREIRSVAAEGGRKRVRHNRREVRYKRTESLPQRHIPRAIRIGPDAVALTLPVKFASVNQDSPGTSTVIRAVPNKRIRVIGYSVSLTVAGTLKFLNTGGPELTGAANCGPMATERPPALAHAFETTEGSGLDISTTTGAAKGHLAYLEV